jgi:hypothetical protein
MGQRFRPRLPYACGRARRRPLARLCNAGVWSGWHHCRIAPVALAGTGEEGLEFANRGRLGHFSGYPLIAKGEFLGVVADYTTVPAEPELLIWWQVYSQMCSVAARPAQNDKGNDRC